MDITHSYQGLGKAYRNARKGSPAFAEFMIASAGLDGEPLSRSLRILELGAGSGQQTEFLENELLIREINNYEILAYDKSRRTAAEEPPGQLDILEERIHCGELSDRVVPLCCDFDGAPLSLDAGSIDFAFMAHVVHHLTRKQAVFSEIERVLRPNGRLFILGVTLEAMVNHPLDEFFPTKYDYEVGRYPPEHDLKDMFLAAGLTFEPPFSPGSHNVRPIDRDFLASVEDTTIDSALKLMQEADPAAFRDGVARVLREVEWGENTGEYRIYRSSDRLRVFWGIKR